MSSIKTFFTGEQQKQIEAAIIEAEKNTSGEIRVHIENNCKGEVVQHAIKVFERLKMHQTKERNGVLIYLAVDDHKFAIIGDEGINNKVGPTFWDNIRDHMSKLFQQQQFAQGLCDGIVMAGEELKKDFPLQHNDKDELSNEVTFNHN